MLLPKNVFYYLARRSGGGGGKTLLHHHLRRAPPPPPRSLPFNTVAANVASKEEDAPSFMVGYLVSSCGFSTDKAIKASKNLTHVKSPHNPDSVLAFLRGEGFDDAQIQSIVYTCPRLLCAMVEKTLEPKIRALRELGFSGSELAQLVAGNPKLFTMTTLTNALPKISFWRTLLGSNDNLLKFLRRNNRFLCCRLDRMIIPNISLLRECGIPDRSIPALVRSSPWLVVRSVDALKALVKRVEELGFVRGSPMFKYALSAVNNLSRSTFDAKLAHLKSLGWTEHETLSAVRRAPLLLACSETKIRKSMDFLVGEVGCKPSDIALRPIMLLFSLEKRVMPRYYIMRILKSKGLAKGDETLMSALKLSERSFLGKFVLQHKDRVPGLQEAYDAACAKDK